jgi:hypothetical protein
MIGSAQWAHDLIDHPKLAGYEQTMNRLMDLKRHNIRVKKNFTPITLFNQSPATGFVLFLGLVTKRGDVLT